MTKWEYKVYVWTSYTSRKEFDAFLNTEGAQGWELVTFNQEEEDRAVYFKRPIV